MDRAPGGGATQVAEASPGSAHRALYPTPVGGSPRILILFSDTGGGHRAAAGALTEALRLLDPSCTVTVACYLAITETAGGTFAAEAKNASITAVQTTVNA